MFRSSVPSDVPPTSNRQLALRSPIYIGFSARVKSLALSRERKRENFRISLCFGFSSRDQFFLSCRQACWTQLMVLSCSLRKDSLFVSMKKIFILFQTRIILFNIKSHHKLGKQNKEFNFTENPICCCFAAQQNTRSRVHTWLQQLARREREFQANSVHALHLDPKGR